VAGLAPLFVRGSDVPNGASKALEIWPALLIAAVVCAALIPAIVYLFRLILKQYEKSIEQRDRSMQALVDSHERAYKTIADSHERGLKHVADELALAIRHSSDDQSRVTQSLMDELRKGR
jgi:hypothetical protein